ncbi:hypothetical protein VSQ48_19945 [Candidatus Ventrimonas sp. KK005]
MRYYSTQRPIMPGSYPKPPSNAVVEIVNFDTRRYCDEIKREAWGYIDYQFPLSSDIASDYELLPFPIKNGDLQE